MKNQKDIRLQNLLEKQSTRVNYLSGRINRVVKRIKDAISENIEYFPCQLHGLDRALKSLLNAATLEIKKKDHQK